jgi:acyl-CoA hydrolase
MSKKLKSPSLSQTQMRQLVMPQHTNPQGTIFGGQIMSWIDIAAAMVASRHSENPVVTVHVDGLSFDEPAVVGDHILIKSMVNFVGKTSMEVGVKVLKENPYNGDQKITTTAYLTFVCLDALGRPTPVPFGLEIQSDDEKRRYENAKKRVAARKALKASLK